MAVAFMVPIIITITKIDLVDEDRLFEVREEVRSTLKSLDTTLHRVLVQVNSH